MVCITLSPLLFVLCSHFQITFDRGRAETPDPVQQLWWTETQPEPIRLRGHCLSHPSFSLKTAKGSLPRAAFHFSQVHFSADVRVGGASTKSPVRCLLIPEVHVCAHARRPEARGAPNHQLMSWWCELNDHVAEEWEPGRSRLPLIFLMYGCSTDSGYDNSH